MRKSFEIVWLYSKKRNWCTNEKKKKLNQNKGAKTCKGRQKLILVVVKKKKSMKEVTNNMISSKM